MKEQEREEKAKQVVQAVQLLKIEMKEKEKIAQKEHRKAMVRCLFLLAVHHFIELLVLRSGGELTAGFMPG